MKPQLKRVDTNSTISLEDACAKDPEKMGFWINAAIGSDETERADDFQIFVCTRQWLDSEHGLDGQKKIKKYLLVDAGCNSVALKEALNSYLSECEGDNWSDLVVKISRIAIWEFDEYRP